MKLEQLYIDHYRVLRELTLHFERVSPTGQRLLSDKDMHLTFWPASMARVRRLRFSSSLAYLPISTAAIISPNRSI